MKYPYTPKSNRKLEVGEFWSIELPNNEFACGIVVDIPNKEKNRVMFVAGLLNWIGKKPPNESILNEGQIEVAKLANAHFKTIISKGAVIKGKFQIESIHNYSTDQQLSTWGYNYINLLAERLLLS